MNSSGEHTQTANSALVSALAWIFIVLAAFAMLVCVAEYALIAVSLPAGTRMLAQADHFGDFGRLVLGHLQPLLLAMLLVFAVTFGTAIALLRRAEWARVVFIALMLLGIFWNLAGAVLTYYFMPASNGQAEPSDVQGAQLAVLRNMALMFNFLVSVASVAWFGWIIRRCMSAEVRREFQRATAERA